MKKLDKADFNTIDFDLLADASDGMSGRDINHISGELANILAERDSGLITLENTLTEVILDCIGQRKRGY